MANQREDQEAGIEPKAMRRACVVVLGDLGRSPRMCNHALSLARNDFYVQLIGYAGSALSKEVQDNERVKITNVRTYPAMISKYLPKLVNYAFKVLWQFTTLLFSLPWFWSSSAPDVLLLQNPPSVPALAVCYAYSKLLRIGRTRLIIDWHNYGYTILSMALGEAHALVRANYLLEEFFGPKADMSFCVTKAMQGDLQEKWNITAHTLYDRAPNQFQPRLDTEKHHLFLKLAEVYDCFRAQDSPGNNTALTEEFANGRVRFRDDRPGVLISSTSWTEDEDFTLFFDALQSYEECCQMETSQLPSLICIITGKGPLKSYYQKIISDQEWNHVEVIMPWLEPEDYPLVLACADLGVCLHTSSSGLDLPMKVVDMFGCGLPVCAVDFPALPELVKHDHNGTVFSNADQLFQQIKFWFQGFPSDGKARRKTFQKNLEQFQSLRWDDNWNRVALPQILKLLQE